jgi:hypothetical protein
MPLAERGRQSVVLAALIAELGRTAPVVLVLDGLERNRHPRRAGVARRRAGRAQLP